MSKHQQSAGWYLFDDGTTNNQGADTAECVKHSYNCCCIGGVAQASNAEASVGIARYRAAYSVSKTRLYVL